MNKNHLSPCVLVMLLHLAAHPSQAATLAHRWSFDTDTSDPIGGNTGILNDGATVDSGQLMLTGLGSGTTGNRMSFTNPVDIGGNFGTTGVTIESWYTDSGTGTWGKLFQFGNNAVGQELAYTHMRGNGQQSGIDRDGAQLLGEQITQNEEHHLVITVSADGNMTAWVDGDKKLTDLDTNDLANVNTTFEAIGATSWGDPGMNGSVNEFRIWEGELTDGEVGASNTAGPDELPTFDDSDDDGLPDLWEERWFGAGNLTQGANDDPDNDGMTNLEEFEFNPNLNPDNDDTDDDGLTDGIEVNTESTDPFDNDSDDDTLSDGAEVNTHMTDPLNNDSDSDFYSDAYEIANGSNPNDASDPGPTNPVLAHRWSFNTGMELIDTAGGNTGILHQTATVSDNQLQLDGVGTGADASSMRFTTPVDIGTNFSGPGFTIETWYTDAGTPPWGKLFTFGTNQAGNEIGWTHQRAGEDLAPGLDRDGAKQIMSIPFGSNDRLSLDEEHHLVITVAPDGTTNLWIDGTQEIVDTASNAPSNIVTNTESIGSTAWNDAGHLGTVNEFRIWKGTLTADDVANNFEGGPDSLSGGKPLQINQIKRDTSTGAVTLTFNSIVGRLYAVDRSPDLLAHDSPLWLELDDGAPATSEISTFVDNTASGEQLFYRVREVTP